MTSSLSVKLVRRAGQGRAPLLWWGRCSLLVSERVGKHGGYDAALTSLPSIVSHTANYLTGSCSIHHLSPHDGSLLSSTPSHLIPFHRDPPTSTGPVSTRQDKSYAHQAIADPSEKWVYIVDLGADCVHRLAVPESGRAEDVRVVGRTRVGEGAGPRHLA